MATKYCATTGSNSNPGTEASPYLTLAFAVAQLFAGDKVRIRGGTYSGSGNVLISSSTTIRGGTSFSNAITIEAYDAVAEPVTLYNTAANNIVAFTSSTQQYIIFSGITFDSSSLSGSVGCFYFGAGPHHIRIQDSTIQGAPADGISSSQANGGGHEFLRLIVRDCGTTFWQHGFYVESPALLIEDCDVYGCAGYGIQAVHGSVADGTIIRRNRVHDNAVSNQGGGIVIGGGENSVTGGLQCYNNLIYGSHPGGYGLAIGFGAGYTAFNFLVANNTILATNAILIEDANGTRLTNNIVRLANNAGPGLIENGGSGTIYTTNLQTSDPIFVNAAGLDFHLQGSSPAKNTGTTVAGVSTDFDLVARPQGVAYDIGAYEFDEGSIPPPPTGSGEIEFVNKTVVYFTTNIDTTATSAAIDTTGANYIVIGVAYPSGESVNPPTDNKGNTYLAGIADVSSNAASRLWYAYNATCGTGHTFTITGDGSANSYAACIAAFSGVTAATDPLDLQDGHFSDPATTLTSGAITPSEDDCLIVTVTGHAFTAASVTIDSGFTITDQFQYFSGGGRYHYGCALAYKIQTTAASVTPTWTFNVAEDWTSTRLGTFTAIPVVASTNAGKLLLMGVGA